MTTQSNGNNLLVQGRIVWGSGSSLFEGKAKTDYNTGAPVLDFQGNPKIEYGFGIAIPKNDANGQPTPEFTAIWNALHQEAFTLYPSGQLPPNFAMKFKDGDTVDHNGKSYSEREGYSNHIILTCTTQIPIKYFRFEGGNNILVNDGIKVGDYVNVQLNIKAHPAKNNGLPGLYLNPSAVQLIQAGKAIVNSPSGDQIFGANAMPSYNGAMVADTAPAMPGQVMPVGQPAAPQIAPAQPMQQQVPAQPAMAPQQAPAAAPNYGVIPAQHQPAAPQMAPAMPGQAPMQPQMGNAHVQAVPQMNAPLVTGGMNPQAATPAPIAANTGVPPMPGMMSQ